MSADRGLLRAPGDPCLTPKSGSQFFSSPEEILNYISEVPPATLETVRTNLLRAYRVGLLDFGH